MDMKSTYTVTMHMEEYGEIIVKLQPVMDAKHITRNKLKDLTHTKYDIVTRYYKGENIRMVDLDFLARACYVLDCKIEDLLEYCPGVKK